jgi:hypothetical protein
VLATCSGFVANNGTVDNTNIAASGINPAAWTTVAGETEVLSAATSVPGEIAA